MIPQSIAYASLANLPSQYGLYAAFMGSFVYIFFGTVKEVSVGATSLMSLLTLQYTLGKPPEYAVILAFLAGCIELLMGLFRLEFIVDFISMPVINAFTSATSLIIIVSQLKNLLGISFVSKELIDTIMELFKHYEHARWSDAILGVISVAFLLLLREINRINLSPERKVLKTILWYISISRNALILLVTSVVAFFWTTMGMDNESLFKLSGKVEPGIPSISLPPFSIEHNNVTASFMEICSDLGSGLIVVPVVAILANVAIAKAFSTGSIVDASQEMLTLGLCNIFGSLFKALPTCGAFTRSAVSAASGVKTPMAGLYSGLLALMSLNLLTPYFYFIPKATLAAVLIAAVMFMIDFTMPMRLWRDNKRDFIVWAGCLIVCLLAGVEIGLLFGVCVNTSHLLFMWARPSTTVKIHEVEGCQYIRITPNVGLFFPGIDFLREKTNRALSAAEYQVPVVIDCIKFTGLDYTSAQGISSLAKDLKEHSQILILENLDIDLQKYIDNSHDNIMFCGSERRLREYLMQESIRNGSIPLMQHIRASIDLGYKVDPLIIVTDPRHDSSVETNWG